MGPSLSRLPGLFLGLSLGLFLGLPLGLFLGLPLGLFLGLPLGLLLGRRVWRRGSRSPAAAKSWMGRLGNEARALMRRLNRLNRLLRPTGGCCPRGGAC
jgi:hypothetical protein